MDADRSTRNQLGRVGEDAAVAAYAADGYRTLARNWRCSIGEIDLVVARGEVLVVCEVKARRGGGFGGPFDAVTITKQRRLRALAVAFLETMRVTGGGGSGGSGGSYDVRFDVASVSVDRSGRAAVHVFEDAF